MANVERKPIMGVWGICPGGETRKWMPTVDYTSNVIWMSDSGFVNGLVYLYRYLPFYLHCNRSHLSEPGLAGSPLVFG